MIRPECEKNYIGQTKRLVSVPRGEYERKAETPRKKKEERNAEHSITCHHVYVKDYGNSRKLDTHGSLAILRGTV